MRDGRHDSALEFVRRVQPARVRFEVSSLDGMECFLRVVRYTLSEIEIRVSVGVEYVPLTLLDAISDHGNRLRTLRLIFEAVYLPSTLVFEGHMHLPLLEELVVVERSVQRSVGVRLHPDHANLHAVVLVVWWSNVLATVSSSPLLRHITYRPRGDDLETVRLRGSVLETLSIDVFYYTDWRHLERELNRDDVRVELLQVVAHAPLTVSTALRSVDVVRIVVKAPHPLEMAFGALPDLANSTLCAAKLVVRGAPSILSCETHLEKLHLCCDSIEMHLVV